jgi:soluble lytic murein transglycosylase-like protein
MACMCGAALTTLQGAGAPSRPGMVASVVRPDPHTGRLVRSVVVARPRPGSAPRAGGSLSRTVDRIARQNRLSPQLIHSVIQVESNYDPFAVSPKGALGLMQLIPSTARRFGVSDVFDPADNIQGGARYLKYLLELYKGDDALALAAYNAGENAVSRYGGVPPYPETWNYVRQVRQRLNGAPAREETAAEAGAVQANEGKTAEKNPAEVYNPIREVRDADGKIYYVSR